jgi:hypothetical protein
MIAYGLDFLDIIGLVVVGTALIIVIVMKALDG